jgi:hypothetical protein
MTADHNPRVGGSSPFSGIAKNPCKVSALEVYQWVRRTADFPTGRHGGVGLVKRALHDSSAASIATRVTGGGCAR